MVRMLHILGGCAILAACGIFSLAVEQWRRGDPELDRAAERPGIVDVFRGRQGGQTACPERSRGNGEQAASPLVAQAEVFAAYLNPPVAAAVEESTLPAVPLTSHGLQASVPPVRPASVSADFRVVAVSCYPDGPERSMALLCPSSSPEGEAKWVKEGAGIGHFVVHEIKQGAVVLRNGEMQCELTVERNRVRRSLVRDVRTGTRQVSAAVDSPTTAPLSPAGPNSIE